MTTFLVVVLSLAVVAVGVVPLLRGAANEIDRMAELEEAQLRINWPTTN